LQLSRHPGLFIKPGRLKHTVLSSADRTAPLHQSPNDIDHSGDEKEYQQNYGYDPIDPALSVYIPLAVRTIFHVFRVHKQSSLHPHLNLFITLYYYFNKDERGRTLRAISKMIPRSQEKQKEQDRMQKHRDAENNRQRRRQTHACHKPKPKMTNKQT